MLHGFYLEQVFFWPTTEENLLKEVVIIKVVVLTVAYELIHVHINTKDGPKLEKLSHAAGETRYII